MRLGIVANAVFSGHRNPAGHPERPERNTAVLAALERYQGAFEPVGPAAPADFEKLRLVHSPEHVEKLRSTAGVAETSQDPDTFTSPRSFEVATMAALSTEGLAARILQGEFSAGFVAARPPGHHAERARAMGFCLFNNVAFAAASVLQRGLAKRVAVVDFDVHHGNGTQAIFWESPEVLYLSSHQFPFYPGTGDLGETGAARGTGFTVNFPLKAGRDDVFYSLVYQRLARRVLMEFRPDLVLVSAGYDAHRLDPLGGMGLNSDTFGVLSRILLDVAGECCQGRILFVLEGGYDLGALGESVAATLDAVLGMRCFPVPSGSSPLFEDYERLVRSRLAPFWACLG